MRDLEKEAREFALTAHGDQKYGDLPYLVHLQMVRDIAGKYLPNPALEGSVLVAAWLHDTVEDTPVSVQDIAVKFGHEVADLVWAVTGVGVDRAARNTSAYRKIAAHRTADAAFLKCCDRLANVSACAGVAGMDEERDKLLENLGSLRRYREEWLSFRTHVCGRLLQGNGGLTAQYRGLVRALDDILGKA